MSRPDAPTTLLATELRLDIGPLQYRLDPRHHLRSLVNQDLAMADQLAQLPLRPGRDVARTQQPMTKQVRNSLRVPDVSLAPRHRLDVLRVHNHHAEPSLLQQVVDRLPLDTGALHPNLSHALTVQPIAQLQQPFGHGRERPRLLPFRRHLGWDAPAQLPQQVL